MDKLDNEGNNEEYFPMKFQKNTYFNFAANIGQKLPLVLTDSLSSCHFFSKDIVIFHSIDDVVVFPQAPFRVTNVPGQASAGIIHLRNCTMAS